jgi:hypothetical protein
MAGRSVAQEDPGRAKVGVLEVTVYYATNGDPSAAGERAQEISADTRERMEKVEHLKFSHYRALGAESQAIFRTYENWAQPLKPSDEILVRFEPRSQPTADAVRLDLELWLSRKKILKTDVSLKEGDPLYVLGPQWRGGRLIIAVALAQK